MITDSEREYIRQNYKTLGRNKVAKDLGWGTDKTFAVAKSMGLTKTITREDPVKKEFPPSIYARFFVDYQDVSCNNGGLIK